MKPTHRDSVAIATLSILVMLLSPPAALGQTKLLRFPDIHGDTIVFCHGADLWRVPASGGTAARLTSHPGEELFPKFSPDGRWIAFTGQIDGDEQVYVIPAAGGVPRQLTFYPAHGPFPARRGYDNQVLGWNPDGSAVLFRSHRDGWCDASSRAFTVSLEGGLPRALPMPTSGAACFSPDGKKVVYSPLFRDFRTWKRYEGGWAQDLFVLDLETLESRNITSHVRTDRDPLWIGESIYFVSDRTGTLNLHRYDLKSGETHQETFGTRWDVRWPGASPDGTVVFEMAGELHIFDSRTRAVRKVEIQVPTDDLPRRPSIISAAGSVEDFSLSPRGERAVMAARGDIFTLPVEHGPTRNLTRSPGAHDREPSWSPDGKSVAFISDRSGEEQIHIAAQDGKGEARQLTDQLKARLYALRWSPDGRSIAFSDKDGKLQVLTVETRELVLVADEERGQLTDHCWSPCSHFLAFSLSDPNEFRSIHIWSLDDRKLHRVTGELTNEYSPAWDPKGERLYFLGDREYAPRIGQIEWDYQLDRRAGIFVLSLRKDLGPLFPPRSDEVTIVEEKPGAAPEKKEGGEGKAEPAKEAAKEAPAAAPREPIRIDFEGLADRVEAVPVEADNYGSLEVTEEHLVYVRGAAFYYGRETDRKPALHFFNLKKREAKAAVQDVGGYALSMDSKKLLFEQGGAYYLMDAKPEGEGEKKKISTAEIEVEKVPAEEWAQIFDEVWRRYRDFFYAENMHGHDWTALREQYRMLLPHVSHRTDLNYLIGEMIAELNVGHAYIEGGDYLRPPRVEVALPGCVLALDAAAGRYRIAKILRGENDSKKYRSPLTEVGVDAREGDYILAIEGIELKPTDDPYRLLRGKGPHPVRWTLSATGAREGAREVTFTPVTSERNLFYWNWVAENRRRVSDLTGGRAGYLHIPDMSAEGITEFIKWFYPQVRKEALVVDARYNGGGNVSEMIIDKLSRKLLMVGHGRTSGSSTYPNVVFHGHMVCILNENSASDGDIFPAVFRRAGLGPLVGKRSWGGIIGISDRGRLMDGGRIFVPEFGNTEPDGEWTIEGRGVSPDFEVENDPRSVAAGRDPQLEKAVELVMKAVLEKPMALPKRPPDPVRP